MHESHLIVEFEVQGVMSRFVARHLTTMRERMRGLLGTDQKVEPVVLSPCRSIHTFGMKYAIDVCLLSRKGVVLASYREVAPRSWHGSFRSVYVLERPASCAAWPCFGQRVVLRECVRMLPGRDFEKL